MKHPDHRNRWHARSMTDTTLGIIDFRRRMVLIGCALIVGASMACASQPDQLSSERLVREHCHDAGDNVWTDLLEKKRLEEFTIRARGMKFSEAADFWCGVRAMPTAKLFWLNVAGFDRTDTLGQFLATTVATYIWNGIDAQPYFAEDEDVLESLAQAVIQVHEGSISGCALADVLTTHAIDVLTDLGELLGDRRKPFADLECQGKRLMEIAASVGCSAEFGKILVGGQPRYVPPAEPLLAAARTGSMQMLTFLLQYHYDAQTLRDALVLARHLPEPIRARAVALISGSQGF